MSEEDSLVSINKKLAFSWHLLALPLETTGVNDYRLVYTDKINLPSEILDSLIAKQGTDPLPSPLIFKVTNPRTSDFTYAGIREFSAESGCVMIPEPIREEINLAENSEVIVSFESLPRGTSVTFQPLDNDQLIDDWKVLLEHRLHSSYTTLTNSRHIKVADPLHAHKIYELQVVDLKPSNAVCIVDTDMTLEILPYNENGKIIPREPTKTVTVEALQLDQPLKLSKSEIGSVVKLCLKSWDHTKDVVISFDKGLLFVGLDEDNADSEKFIFSNIDDPNNSVIKISASNAYLADAKELWFTAVLQKDNCEFVLTQSSFGEQSIEEDDGDFQVCSNCRQKISRQAYMLHSAFCQRNNILCPQGCGQIFSKRNGSIPKDHWHCQKCLPNVIYGDDLDSLHEHERLAHQRHTCGCGEEFLSYSALGLHRATSCPNKIIICRFCHLKLPQGLASPQDILQGLSGHESYCGGRTTDCESCGKAIRLRDLDSHMKYHDKDRLASATPQTCTNLNCPNVTTSSSPLGLCTICYGPLYSNVNDPSGARLKQRIERRYVIQLTRGCGKSWCMNKFCASSNGEFVGRPIAEVMKKVSELLSGIDVFYFCVDEAATKRKLFIDFESETSEYAKPWLARAIEAARGNEQEARRWLNLNGVRVSEVAAH